MLLEVLYWIDHEWSSIECMCCACGPIERLDAPSICLVCVNCSVVFCTQVGVFVFSVMWSELLMTAAICCPLWSSVYECHKVECAFTSPVRTRVVCL